MYIHTYVCVRACIHVCDVHVWAPEEAEESITNIPQPLSTLFLRQGFSLNLEFTTLVIWLTSPQAPPALASPSTMATKVCCQALFMWVLRIHDYTVNTLPTEPSYQPLNNMFY